MKTCPECQAEYPEQVEFCPKDGMKLRTKRAKGADPLVGKVLDGRWIIEEKIGEGGMGAVYKGHQQSVQRTVAIKTLRPQLAESEEFSTRFFREARVATRMSHPHVVTILDFGQAEDDTLYLAMEFLEGEPLTDRIEAGTLTVREVVEIAIQVSSALAAAHEQSIVHRDLKPDNIFLQDVAGGATFAKVLDFGIAKVVDSNTQVTKTGMIFGTPEYMSPEQCRGDANIDGRSDLYALGCILYEVVGGRAPFRGTTPMSVLLAHVNEEAPALSTQVPSSAVPPELEAIIMQLLQKDRERRPSSAAVLQQALEKILQNLDNPTANVTGPRQAPVIPPKEVVAPEVNIGFDATMGIDTGQHPELGHAGDTVTAVSAEDPQPDAPVSSNGKLIGLAAIVIVLVVAASGIVIAMLRSGSEPEVPAMEQTAEAVTAVDEPSEGAADPKAEDPEPAAPVAANEAEPAAEKTDEGAGEKPETEPTKEPEVAAAAPENPPDIETKPKAEKIERDARRALRKGRRALRTGKRLVDEVRKAEPDPSPSDESPKPKKGRKGKDKALDDVLDGLGPE